MAKHTLINIGRQFGSGGKSTAEALSLRLGIPVYDNDLIAKAAEQSGFSRSLLSERDEEKSFFLLGFSNRYVSDNAIFDIESKTIRNIAEQGPAIFVGRASDYVLRDMECLDVFITAPVEARIARISERHGISEEEAAAMIEKKDKRREAYYNYFTFGHWGMASNYDLCIDSSILGIDGTADYIIDFGKKSGYIK